MSPLILVFDVTMFLTYNPEHLDGILFKNDIADTQLFLSHFLDTFLTGFPEADTPSWNMPALAAM